jgi:hypothetical protein
MFRAGRFRRWGWQRNGWRFPNPRGQVFATAALTRGLHWTHRWSKPDSNVRSRVLHSGINGSQIRRWREMDSNPRSLGAKQQPKRVSPFLVTALFATYKSPLR